ncbi:hypothetical protein DCC81_13700 [Chitinophaga parva]|uniref:Uncharacterized protein n=2 Tax=Chitinophaga parva TaxID=2169414 RepID=A0A2T7BGD3_9BACT|nr:hypothetical protein DCC81_13700 [Chitinophaga parva]
MEDKPQDGPLPDLQPGTAPAVPAAPRRATQDVATGAPVRKQVTGEAAQKYQEHFNRLFAEARLPGPGYLEFSRMTAAMQSIADEKARFCAAFAGLQVQGLDKEKLLSSAQDYLQLLASDAVSFHQTIDAALDEKVKSRKAAIEDGKARIQQLSREIMQLQQQLQQQEQEVAESEAKLDTSAAGYNAALLAEKDALMKNIEKINQHIL